MADINALTKLKEKVDRLRSDADRAAGALEQTMKKLKSEYGCTTLEQAEKKLKELAKEEQAAEKEFNAAVADFEAKYEDQL